MSRRRTAYSVQRTASLLLGTLLFATAACQKPQSPRTGAAAKGIDPAADQVAFGSRTLVTDGGLRRAEVLSDTALFYDDNTRMEMRIVNAVFYNSAGAKEAVLTSRTGRYLTRDGLLEARGRVVITTVDGRKLTSEMVRFDQRVNQISSDSAFVLTEDGREASGVGFVSDPDMNNIRILHASRAKAGQLRVPKN
ncbi:MAG: LPS export ABC transporter periplasmic protein LptC [Gemmatimonadota bacterium]